MIIKVYYLVHVLSLLALTGVTFAAFAAPDPERRRKTLMTSGILAFTMLVGGFGLLARLYGNEHYPWVIGKLVCWLLLAGISGFAFRKREMVGTLRLITIAILAVGVYLVYFKPGHTVSTSPIATTGSRSSSAVTVTRTTSGATPATPWAA